MSTAIILVAVAAAFGVGLVVFGIVRSQQTFTPQSSVRASYRTLADVREQLRRRFEATGTPAWIAGEERTSRLQRELVSADLELRPGAVGWPLVETPPPELRDVTEAAAIRDVFGAHAGGLPVSSTKSMHGHALGAAGAIEAIATILALRNGLLPPTAGFRQADPECNLDVIPNQARPSQPEFAISNSFAFGGLNAVLAFRKFYSAG